MANAVVTADMIGRIINVANGTATFTILGVTDEAVHALYQREGLNPIELDVTQKNLSDMFAQGKAAWQDSSTKDTEDTETEDTEAPKTEPKKDTKSAAKSAKSAAKKTIKAKRVEIPEAEVIDDDDKDEHENTDNEPKGSTEAVDDNPMDNAEFEKLMASINNIGATEDSSTEDTEDTEEVEDTEEEPKGFKKSAKSAKSSTKSTKGTKSGKYVFATYTTRRGKEAPKIMGFDEKDEAYQNAAMFGGARSSEYVKVGSRKMKVYCIIFGTKWFDLAKNLTNALNEGASMEDLQEIADTAKDAHDEAMATKKAEYEEKKAERAKAKEAKAKEAAKGAAKEGEKLYTKAEVEAKIRLAFATFFGATCASKKEAMEYVKAAEPVIKQVA